MAPSRHLESMNRSGSLPPPPSRTCTPSVLHLASGGGYSFPFHDEHLKYLYKSTELDRNPGTCPELTTVSSRPDTGLASLQCHVIYKIVQYTSLTKFSEPIQH